MSGGRGSFESAARPWALPAAVAASTTVGGHRLELGISSKPASQTAVPQREAAAGGVRGRPRYVRAEALALELARGRCCHEAGLLASVGSWGAGRPGGGPSASDGGVHFLA